MVLRLGSSTLSSTRIVLLITCICSAAALRLPLSVAGGSSDNSEHAAGQAASSPNQNSAGDAEKPKNNRVIIGVLSQPSDPSGPGESYIAASYVKFLEASGARVVPFVHNLPKHEIKRLFKIVNGFLIPGGSAPLRPGHSFFDTAAEVVRLAKLANDHGDAFPILGICLGFEALAIITSGNTSIMSSYDAEDGAAPLYFTEKAKLSRFFSGMRPEIVADLAAKPYARESHSRGLSLRSFDASAGLREEYEVLSLSTDPEGEVYISTMESKLYPFTATQWHPEKNAFEWGDKLHIPHSRGAVEVTHAVSSFFVEQARSSFHKARDVLEEDEVLISNYRVEFTGRHEHADDFTWMDEAYFFEDWREAAGAAGATL